MGSPPNIQLKQVSETEVTIANLQRMRQQLSLEIQRLMATLPEPKKRKKESFFIDPRTGKKVHF